MTKRLKRRKLPPAGDMDLGSALDPPSQGEEPAEMVIVAVLRRHGVDRPGIDAQDRHVGGWSLGAWPKSIATDGGR